MILKSGFVRMAVLLLCVPGAPDMQYGLHGTCENNDEWILVKDSKGVQTYERWVKTAKGDKTRERRGEMIIDCTVEDAVKTLSDTRSVTEWMSNVRESFNLKRESQFEWYTYTLFNMPWPFENRDLVSEVTIKKNHQNDSVCVKMTSREDYIPVKPGITRLTDYTACWQIIRLMKDRVKITFTAISYTPPLFPRWIQDPVVEHMFHNNLIRLKSFMDDSCKSD